MRTMQGVWATVLVAAVGVCACAQQESGEENIRDALVRLWEQPERVEIERVASALDEENMFFSPPEPDMSLTDALAILRANRAYVESVLEASRLDGYDVAEIPPHDPFEELLPDMHHLSAIRGHARILGFDSRGRWADREFDLALGRVEGIVRLADALLDSTATIPILTGYAIRGLAFSHLEEIVGWAEEWDRDGSARDSFPRFDAHAVGSLVRQIRARPSDDPYSIRKMVVHASSRRVKWLRSAFTGDGGGASYRRYLVHHGFTRVEERDLRAMLRGLPADEQAMLLTGGASIVEVWDQLDQEQREEAMAEYDAFVAQIESSPFGGRPRLYADDPAQRPTSAQIEGRLDGVDEIITRLDGAETRAGIREAIALFDMQAAADRSQVTSLSMSVGVWLYAQSLEDHRDMLMLAQRLEQLIADE